MSAMDKIHNLLYIIVASMVKGIKQIVILASKRKGKVLGIVRLSLFKLIKNCFMKSDYRVYKSESRVM